MAAFRIIRRLRDLYDFTLGSPSDGDRVTYDAATGGFVLSAASASGQPLDSDLTAIAALTTTAFGRGLLALANQAALLSTAGAAAASHAHSGAEITSGTVVDARIDAAIARDSEVTSAISALSSVYQPLDSDLTAVAALTTTSYGRALLEAANLAALYTIIAVDTDGTLTANSDAKLASQKAVKTYVTANAGASFATPAIVLGTAAAAGAASTVIRSDGTIAAFDATVPSTQAFGDAAAAGSAAFAARRDHKHAMPAVSAFIQTLLDDANAATARATLGASVTGTTPILPSGAIAQSFDRYMRVQALVQTAQRLTLVGVYLPIGVVVTSISFMSGATALSGGTHQFFGLYDSSRNRLASTADDTSTAWGANTVKTLNLTAPFTTTYEGPHYLGILIDASGPPTIICGDGNWSQRLSIPPIANGLSSTGVTSLPNPAAALTPYQLPLYAYCS